MTHLKALSTLPLVYSLPHVEQSVFASAAIYNRKLKPITKYPKYSFIISRKHNDHHRISLVLFLHFYGPYLNRKLKSVLLILWNCLAKLISLLDAIVLK